MRRLLFVATGAFFVIATLLPTQRAFVVSAVSDGERLAMFSKPAVVRIIDGAILTGNMVVEADVFIGPGVHTINDNDVYLKRFGLAPFGVRGPTIRRFALGSTRRTAKPGPSCTRPTRS